MHMKKKSRLGRQKARWLVRARAFVVVCGWTTKFTARSAACCKNVPLCAFWMAPCFQKLSLKRKFLSLKKFFFAQIWLQEPFIRNMCTATISVWFSRDLRSDCFDTFESIYK